MDWFTELFINEVKPALDYHSDLGGGSDSDDKMFILVDEDGTEYPAVVVSEETVFDATANDIREGKIAATEEGVTVGTKDIPAYYVTEGYVAVTNGRNFAITFKNDDYQYTKLQAIICPFSGTVAKSVAADKVGIDKYVYEVNSTEVLSTITVTDSTRTINFGLVNDTGKPYLLRYFTYKEEY